MIPCRYDELSVCAMDMNIRQQSVNPWFVQHSYTCCSLVEKFQSPGHCAQFPGYTPRDTLTFFCVWHQWESNKGPTCLVA